ncbi:alpha/beta hydrolase-fold protein [Hymenobacter sp. GOD-10R]|uniref:alpha/beta hydrolase-fold protein n=1 Tax=Hymenobacter sp. GOD-10R TaxID=3093922 RepID=UPI002D79E755|nr:alpha/beta hydrolase-fold protein [Hymenobacter sp. GOD-10R]WRQ31819.1 alpha/beta hydrolase-fold protein [Hymenobacter sp. GOD-10R]
MLLLWSSLPGRAQAQVRGLILDAETKQPVPAVTIRLGSGLATSSGADGSFSLAVPTRPDTIQLARLGYVPQTIAVPPGPLPTYYLHRQQAVLPPVAITARRWIERQIGITSARALVHFTDGTLLPGKPVEIAQLMRVGSAGAALTSVNLLLAATCPDSITVRVRFYRLEGDRPTTLLVEQPLTYQVALQQGWLRLDLTRHHLYLTQDFVVGLTFLLTAKPACPVPVDIKLGGSAKSFARPAGATEWRVPPHHYRLYITAQMPDHAVSAGVNEAENRETPAAARLYSRAVQDSFSLFVQLPKGYAHAAHRHYPLVVLLDGNVYFDQVSEAARHLPRREALILVGVGRPSVLQQDSLRQRDYTYPAALPADSLPLAGGGRQFLAFLEQELLPYLDRTYRIDSTHRTLMGHSLGGYFTLFALVEELNAKRARFSQYVAASPSLYYANQYLLQALAALTPTAPSQPLRVRLTIGSQEMTTTAEGRANQAAFQEALALLSARKLAPLTVEHTVYPGYRHLETAVPTFTMSLQQGKQTQPTEAAAKR